MRVRDANGDNIFYQRSRSATSSLRVNISAEAGTSQISPLRLACWGRWMAKRCIGMIKRRFMAHFRVLSRCWYATRWLPTMELLSKIVIFASDACFRLIERPGRTSDASFYGEILKSDTRAVRRRRNAGNAALTRLRHIEACLATICRYVSASLHYHII